MKKTYDETQKQFYVYEWFRVSDGHVFYVGKGKGDRARQRARTKRNSYFFRYVNKYECDYRILKDGLTEQEAYDLEDETCQARKKNGEAECNIGDTSCRTGGPGLAGEKNGMWGRTHTPEVRRMLSEINRDGRNAGENNTQYGVSPKNRMDEETYQTWRRKQRARKFGKTNPKAHLVIMFRPGEESYRVFETVLDCAQWLIDNVDRLSRKTRETVRGWVKDCARYANVTKEGYAFIIIKKSRIEDIGNIVPRLPEVETYRGRKATHFRLEGVTTTERRRSGGEPSRVGEGRNSLPRSASHPERDEEIV